MKHSSFVTFFVFLLIFLFPLTSAAQGEGSLPVVDAPGVLIEGEVVFDNIKFEIQRIDFWSRIDTTTPSKDLYLAVLGSISSTNTKRACLKKSDFKLQIGTRDYAPVSLANNSAKKFYKTGFPKAVFGHCIQSNETEITFLLFDVSDQNGQVRLTFDRNKSLNIASITELLEYSGFEYPTPTPTNTRRPTRTPRPTKTPRPTPTSKPSATPKPATDTSTLPTVLPAINEVAQIEYPVKGIAIQNGNLLGGPGASYAAIAGIFADTEVSIVGVSEDGLWYELEGNYWIDASFIESEGMQNTEQAVNTVATPNPTTIPSTPSPVSVAMSTSTFTPVPTLIATPIPSDSTSSQRTYEEQVYLDGITEIFLTISDGIDELGRLLSLLDGSEYLILDETWRTAILDAATNITISNTYIEYLTPPDRLINFHRNAVSAANLYNDGTLLQLEGIDAIDVNKIIEGQGLYGEANILLQNTLSMLTSEAEQMPTSEPLTSMMQEGTMYTIFKEDTIPGIKRSLDIQLSKRVTEDVLESIAFELKNSDSKTYERTFIGYYLPNMDVEGAAWATTHFNPNLEVKILGLRLNEAQELLAIVDDPSRAIIGRWLNDSPYSGNKTTIFYEADKFYMEEIYRDGSIGLTELTEESSAEGRKFVDPECCGYGEFFLIDAQENLQIWDENGLIYTIIKFLNNE